ncbi:transcription factor subunit Med10 [Diplocarpon rosae]|nr:transcription factor subunit Med10 [Diplocarpon rosae]
MAPVSPADHDVVERQIKEVIQDLFQIMVQVNSYDQAGKPSKDVLENAVKQFDNQLLKVYNTASRTNSFPSIPPELIQYVDNGRNPDIYTREFVELVRKGNQLMKGKMDAYASFRDVLAQEIGHALPEVRDDVVKALLATGGDPHVLEKREGST